MLYEDKSSSNLALLGRAPSKQKHNNGVTKSCTNHDGANPSNYQRAAWLHTQCAPHRTLLPVADSSVPWVCQGGVAKVLRALTDEWHGNSHPQPTTSLLFYA